MEQAAKNERILRKKEVLSMLGISDPTLWRWERAGTFPKRLRLGGSACGWLLSEVETWIRERANERISEGAQ